MGLETNGSDLDNMLNSLFLDLSTFDNICWFLDMNDEALRHPPHKALFVFSSEFDCIFWIPAWAAEDISSAVFSFIFSHVPLCTLCFHWQSQTLSKFTNIFIYVLQTELSLFLFALSQGWL